MGEKTVEVTQKLRYALDHAVEFGQRHEGGDVAPSVAKLERELRVAISYEERWAFLAHGGRMETSSELVDFRQEWYEWTKGITALTTVIQLSAEDRREPLSPSLPDAEAEAFRKRVAEQLEVNPAIDESAEAALVVLSRELCDTDADWSVVSATMIAGYWLRRAESESHCQIDAAPETVARLLRIAAAEPDGVPLLGAISMLGDVEGSFSGGGRAWAQIRTWAISNARDRSLKRRRRGIEPDAEPNVSEEICGRAFTAGYAVCFVEQTMGRVASH